MHGHIKEYRTTENILVPGQHYHEVIYECDPGYKLTDQGLGHMFCQQKGWMGIEPYCEDDPDDTRPKESDEYLDNEDIAEEEIITTVTSSIVDSLGVHPSNVVVTVDIETGEVEFVITLDDFDEAVSVQFSLENGQNQIIGNIFHLLSLFLLGR